VNREKILKNEKKNKQRKRVRGIRAQPRQDSDRTTDRTSESTSVETDESLSVNVDLQTEKLVRTVRTERKRPDDVRTNPEESQYSAALRNIVNNHHKGNPEEATEKANTGFVSERQSERGHCTKNARGCIDDGGLSLSKNHSKMT